MLIILIGNNGNILTDGNGRKKEFKENYKRTKNLYNALKEDKESVLFASEHYEKDNIFLKLYNKIENVNIKEEKEIIPTFIPCIEKKEILIVLLCIVLMVHFNFCMLT